MRFLTQYYLHTLKQNVCLCVCVFRNRKHLQWKKIVQVEKIKKELSLVFIYMCIIEMKMQTFFFLDECHLLKKRKNSVYSFKLHYKNMLT